MALRVCICSGHTSCRPFWLWPVGPLGELEDDGGKLPAGPFTMAAFTSMSPGRTKIMKEAAVPPTMCSTAPRSLTCSSP